MPTQIEIDGEGILEFPDEMSEDQIKEVLRKKFPPPAETAEREQAKAQIAAEREQLKREGAVSGAVGKVLGVAEQAIEPLTPSGLLNQPARIGRALGAEVPEDPFQPGVPQVTLPKPEGTGVAAGLGRLAAGVAEGFTTPEMLVTLPAAPASAAVRALFAGEMAKNLPESIGAAGEVLRAPEATTADKIEAAGQPLVSAAFIRGLARTPELLPNTPRTLAMDAADMLRKAELEAPGSIRNPLVEQAPRIAPPEGMVTREVAGSATPKRIEAPAEVAAPVPEPTPAKPDFKADNSHPVGSEKWRIANAVPDGWKVINLDNGAWVAESPTTKASGKWGKLVKTSDAQGNGRIYGVGTSAPPEPTPAQPTPAPKAKRARKAQPAPASAEAPAPTPQVTPQATPQAQAKEPWQMTREEWVEATRAKYAADNAELKAKGFSGGIEPKPDAHYYTVRNALEKGKPVPPEVLKDYPDLAKPTAPAEAAAPALPKAKAKDWTDRNKFVGEHFAGPKNSIVIQLRGLDTMPLGTGKPTVLPFDGNPKTAAKTVEMVFQKLARESNASMRESVIKATDENGTAIYHFQWKPEGVGYATQTALNEARARYREVTSGKAKPTINVEQVAEPKQLPAPAEAPPAAKPEQAKPAVEAGHPVLDALKADNADLAVAELSKLTIPEIRELLFKRMGLYDLVLHKTKKSLVEAFKGVAPRLTATQQAELQRQSRKRTLEREIANAESNLQRHDEVVAGGGPDYAGLKVGQTREQAVAELAAMQNELGELQPAPTPEPALTGMGGAVASEFGPQAKFDTAAKNAAIDRDRVERGQPPMMAALRKSDADLWAQAMNVLENDWQAPDKLIASLKANPRVLLDWEHMVLLARRVDIKNEWFKAQREMELATEEGRPEAAESARAVRDDMTQRLIDLDSVVGRGDTAAGTIAGRALRARQLVMAEDYSLAEQVSQRESVLGRKLSEQEFAETKKLADDAQRLNAEYDNLLKKHEERIARQQEAQILEAALRDPRTANLSDKVIQIAEEIVKGWDVAADAARQRLLKRTGQFSSGIDPTILADVAIVGRSYLGHAALDAAKFTQKLVGELGEWAREYAKPAFDKAQELAEAETKRQPRAVRTAIKVKKGDVTATVKRVAELHAKNKDFSWHLQKLARYFVAQGERNAQALVDKVYDAIKAAVPQLSRREVMDALSGYGNFMPLSKEAITVALRDLKGQLQQIAKLEDMAAGKAPRKSGFERRAPSDEERRLIKQVEAKKREGGYSVTDPETQLRTAMQAAKTRLTNQISDLEHQIRTRTKIVKEKRELKPDRELEALRARRDELKAQFDEVFPERPMTEAERLALWKERTLDKIEELKDKVRRGDISKRKKPDPIRLDPEAIKIRYELHKVHNALLDLRLKDQLSQRTRFRKVVDGVGNVVRFSRAAMTGGEFSGVLRQGGALVFAHPVRSSKAIAPMFRAFSKEERAFAEMEEIMTRENAPLYQRHKLELTETGVRLSNLEEYYMFRVSENIRKIPGIGHSVKALEAFQRAYTVVLNRLRADAFDAMADIYGKDPATLDAIANFINVATGRGSTGLGNRLGAGANTVFFAPRYSISRLQLLVAQPIFAAKGKANKAMIAKEYMRMAAGAAVVLSLGYMYAKAMGEDDPLEADPRSADFGKIKIGDTRIDPMFGLAQWSRLLATIGSGTRKDSRGRIRPIRNWLVLADYDGSSKLGPYEPTGSDILGRFAWGKLAPAPEAFVSGAGGENVVGDEFTLKGRAVQAMTPITYRDIYEAYGAQDEVTATLMAILSVFGWGVNTYD